ncbi:hypothetical protein [Sphingomonas elodea]|uniref:hypothetical protein n=1 Tax=Sphingomonas elodea TaxID=179878 RepID=UPI0002630117|nr:hypothetical protein [Sphingomonas elodea]
MKPSLCWILVPLALLGACGGTPTENAADDPANAAVQPGPMLGSVDLSRPLQLRGGALETGWRIDLAPGRILYRPADGKPVPFYPISPQLTDGKAVYPTETPDGAPVTITLRPGTCGDGGVVLAEVRIGARVLEGCGHPQTIEQVHRDMYNEALAVPYEADNAGNAVGNTAD